MWAAHRRLVKALAAALLDSLPVQVLSPGKTGQRSWHLADVPGEQATALDLGLVSKNVSPQQWDGHHFHVTALSWPARFRCLQLELTDDCNSSSRLRGSAAAKWLVLLLGPPCRASADLSFSLEGLRNPALALGFWTKELVKRSSLFKKIFFFS